MKLWGHCDLEVSRTDGNNEKDCECLERFPFEFAKRRNFALIRRRPFFVGYFNGDFDTSAGFSTSGTFQL